MNLSRPNQMIKLAVDGRFLIPDLSTGKVYGIRGKVVGSVNHDGYIAVVFHDVLLLAHRVIAYAAWGELLFVEGMHVNHKNGNKLDNRVENLEIVTVAENVRHAWASGFYDNPSGEEAHNVKLTEEQVTKIRELVSRGLTYRKIGGIFNVSRTTVYNIVKGRTWREHASKDN